ncbi:hypothetical protein [Aquirufa nivalisilvae]|uniref:hypothetical protein n=1 Tax=Aquirufa nivalisilvae TaxID=2516557 RepID=UPI00137648C9|nr:hypothetical protein [Aquirufa nivalisilvae]
MKNNHPTLQADSLNTDDKKKWIEPQINAWENDNLGVAFGVGGDGGSKSSAI